MTIKELRAHKRKIALDIENMEREYEKAKTNHILHVILTVVTAGFWIVVWLIISLSNSSKRNNIEKLINESKIGIIEIDEMIDDRMVE